MMTKFSLFILIAVLITAFALAGCGGGGGGGTSLNPPNTPGGDDIEPPPDSPFLPGDGGSGGTNPSYIFVTGRVVGSGTQLGVANVKIIFTNKADLRTHYTANTSSTGQFSIGISSGTAVLSLFDYPYTFAVDTASVAGTYPTTGTVVFRGNTYTNQSWIDVPQSILTGEELALGDIIISAKASGGDGGGNDPPPVLPPMP